METPTNKPESTSLQTENIHPDPVTQRTWGETFGETEQQTISGLVPLAVGNDGRLFSNSPTTPPQAVVVPQSSLDVAGAGWAFSGTFYAASSNIVEWSAGTLTTEAGDTYSIGTGNTGTMSAKTRIYFDVNASTTAFQTTTTDATAVGTGKILIATAEDADPAAKFFVLNDAQYNVDASNIVANSITGNELNTSLLYAGSINLDVLGNIRSGQTDYNTGTGFWIGNHQGTTKLSMGSTTSAYSTIVYDTVSNGGEDSNVSSSTHSHTCTGSNLTLLIFVASKDDTAADRAVTSVTYAGVACTKIRSDDNNNVRHSEVWALKDPTTGANNIVVTMGGTCATLTVCGVSLTGTGNIVSSAGISWFGSSTSASVSLTTLVDNSWVVGVLHTTNAGSSYSEGSGQTNRFSQAGSSSDVQVSTKPVTTAGDTTFSWTWTGLALHTLSAVVIQPAGTITTNNNYFLWDGDSLEASGALNASRTFTTYDEFDGSSVPDALFVNSNGFVQRGEADVSGNEKFIGLCSVNTGSISPTFVNATTGTSDSFSVTCNAGTNRVLIVQIAIALTSGSSVSSVVWGATSLTKIDEDVSGTSLVQSVWYAAIGTSGSNQTNTLTITDNWAGTYNVIAATFNNVNQTTPIGNSSQGTGTDTNPTATIVLSKCPSRVVSMFGKMGDVNSVTWQDSQTTDSSVTSSATLGTFMGSVLRTQAASNAYNATAGSAGNEWTCMALELVGSSASVPVVYMGEVGGFSGLTVGSTYYLSNTAGAIGTSAGATSLVVGKATSATQLLVIQA